MYQKWGLTSGAGSIRLRINKGDLSSNGLLGPLWGNLQRTLSLRQTHWLGARCAWSAMVLTGEL